jgi:hypothetical protein
VPRRKWSPPFVHCRPHGCDLPLIESEPAYLARLCLLGADERTALSADAFEPEAHDPDEVAAWHGDREREKTAAAGGRALWP